jgi:hypothetical protein
MQSTRKKLAAFGFKVFPGELASLILIKALKTKLNAIIFVS